MAEPETPSGAFHAVILAAGAGTRFGGEKLRASWCGRPLIAGAVAAACASPAATLTLVTGADPAVAEAAREGCGRLLVVVHAPDWSEGMAASLRAGFSSVPAGAAGVFVFLGDMPRIPHALAGELAAALAGGAVAAAPVCGGRRGHPVLVGPGLLAQVALLSGEGGLNGVLAGLGARLALVETSDDGVLFDVDTPEALAQAR